MDAVHLQRTCQRLTPATTPTEDAAHREPLYEAALCLLSRPQGLTG